MDKIKSEGPLDEIQMRLLVLELRFKNMQIKNKNDIFSQTARKRMNELLKMGASTNHLIMMLEPFKGFDE